MKDESHINKGTKENGSVSVKPKEILLETLSLASECFLSDKELTRGIEEVLKKIEQSLDAHNVILFKSSLEGDNQIFFRPHFRRDGDNASNQIDLHEIEQSTIMRWISQFESHEPISGITENLPVVEREFFGFFGIKSLISIPVRTKGLLWGFVLITDLFKKREWSKLEVNSVMAIARMLGTALMNAELEQGLAESREKSHMITEHSSDVIYRLRFTDMKYDYMSPSIVKITGYTAEEIKETGIRPIIDSIEKSSIDSNEFEDIYERWNKGEIDEYVAEYIISTKNGDVKWLRDQSFPWRDKSGKVIGSIGALQDITGLRKMEGELRYHDEILKVISYSAEAFLTSSDWQSSINEVLERLGNAIDANRAYIAKSIYENGEIVAHKILYEWSDDNHPMTDMPQVIYLPVEKSPIREWVDQLELGEIVRGNRDDFSPQTAGFMEKVKVRSILGTPIMVNNKLWGLMGFDDCEKERTWFKLDIEAIIMASRTLAAAIQRTAHENELVEAKNRAEKSDRLKSEFLAQISHEIRTPVNSIQSFISLIRADIEDDVPDDLKTAFKMVSNGCYRLIRTVDLILNMSEIQLGTYEPKLSEVNLCEDILRPLINEYGSAAAAKKLELKTSKETKKTFVNADRYSVHQIFNNLLDNALKFTEHGTISLRIYDEEDSINVEVADTGIGISEDFLPEIFEPFSQEESGYTRRYDGTGLGLPLAQKYCELNNAAIDVETTKGKGTKFTVKFPKS